MLVPFSFRVRCHVPFGFGVRCHVPFGFGVRRHVPIFSGDLILPPKYVLVRPVRHKVTRPFRQTIFIHAHKMDSSCAVSFRPFDPCSTVYVHSHEPHIPLPPAAALMPEARLTPPPPLTTARTVTPQPLCPCRQCRVPGDSSLSRSTTALETRRRQQLKVFSFNFYFSFAFLARYIQSISLVPLSIFPSVWFICLYFLFWSCGLCFSPLLHIYLYSDLTRSILFTPF